MKFNIEIKQKGIPTQQQSVEAEGCIQALNQVLDSNESFDEKTIEKIVCKIE